MDCHTPLKDDGGKNRNLSFSTLAPSLFGLEAIQFKQLSAAPENIEVVD